jgi:hypothetical protein
MAGFFTDCSFKCIGEQPKVLLVHQRCQQHRQCMHCRCHLPVSLTPAKHRNNRISLRIFEKNQNRLIGLSTGARRCCLKKKTRGKKSRGTVPLNRPPEIKRSPAWPWSAVRWGSSQHSNQFLVPGRVECGGMRVLSRASSLTLSKCSTYICCRTVLGRFLKPHHSITHLPNTGRGEFTPREIKVKTERTPVVYRLLDPSWIRVNGRTLIFKFKWGTSA